MPREHSPTRRRFLQGRPARAPLGDEPQPADKPDGYLVTVSRRAMACTFTVHMNATAGPAAVEDALAALDLIELLETQMTVYGETSEVIEINRLAAFKPVEVEPQLFGLLVLGQEIARETGGAFDMTSGPLSQAWGFSRRHGRIPDEAELAAACERVGFAHLAFDAAGRTVRFDRPGVELQLNGIGKGYALDRAADVLTAAPRSEGIETKAAGSRAFQGPHAKLSGPSRRTSAGTSDEDDACRGAGSCGRDFLLHGGQSSVLARGDNAARPDGGWSVGVRHPLRTAERLGEFILRDHALGTSGSATQSFHRQGRRFGHLLDPRTGMPAEGVHTSTVLAPTAAQADALATAMYVLGPDGAAAFCQDHAEIAVLLVCPGERSGEIRQHAFNLPPDVWQPRS